MGFARAVYYHRIGPLPLIGRAMVRRRLARGRQIWRTRDAISFSDTYKAGSVFLAADTWLGPFYVAWGHTQPRRVELLPLPWPTLDERARERNAEVARAQPRRRLASVHADEGARDAAARADRARRRRVAVRLRRPPLPRRGELVVGQPVRPRAIRASTPRSRAQLDALDARRCSPASRTGRWSSCRSGWPHWRRAGLGHAFYGSDGASATEIALKMSFHYWRNRGQPDKRGFVSLAGSYHGETLGALAVTDVAAVPRRLRAAADGERVVPCPDSRGAGGCARSTSPPRRRARGASRAAPRRPPPR